MSNPRRAAVARRRGYGSGLIRSGHHDYTVPWAVTGAVLGGIGGYSTACTTLGQHAGLDPPPPPGTPCTATDSQRAGSVAIGAAVGALTTGLPAWLGHSGHSPLSVGAGGAVGTLAIGEVGLAVSKQAPPEHAQANLLVASAVLGLMDGLIAWSNPPR